MATVWADLEQLIVPLDGRNPSVRALPVAGRLATRLGIGIRLVAAVTDGCEQLSEWMTSMADRYLSDSRVTVEVLDSDDPVEAISQVAGAGRIVCMATAASLLPHQGHAGSVAEGVIRRVGQPVFLVGPHMEPTPPANTQRVVVPVDGSERSESAVTIAADLAQRLQVPVWIVSVVDPGPGRRVAAMSVDVTAAETAYVRDLASRIRSSRGIDAEFDVLHGDDPATAIVEFAGDDGTVVMSTHGRSGLSRLFAGSVTSKVVADSQRAVLVWRPSEA